MNAKWMYMLALLCLPLMRVAVLNTDLDLYLANTGFMGGAQFIQMLRTSPPFIDFIGNWALPVFAATAIIYWITDTDDSDISKQFLLLPIAYIPFSIVGMVLKTASFQLSYLYVHPLVILPFGYFYVFTWALLVWILSKLRIVQ
jgi:hypothetical protein